VSNENESDIIGVRVPEGTRERIKKEIQDGKKHRNKSELVLYAIHFYLDYLENQRIEAKKEKMVVVETRN
jgi:Arc/MetJ-type ribon-helix-helix transcriptional regulator